MEISKAQSLPLPSRSSCHGTIPTTAGSCVLKGERSGHRMTPILFFFLSLSLSFSTLVIYGANSTFNVCGFKLVVTRQHNEGSHARRLLALSRVSRAIQKVSLEKHGTAASRVSSTATPPRWLSGRLRFHTHPPLGSWWWCYRFLFHPFNFYDYSVIL